MRILHIDDDEDDHEIFATALSEASTGIELSFIDNARDALQNLMLASQYPDIIFLDLNMPEMNGQQFLMEIKKQDKLKNIPIIILSTSSHKPTIELTREAGAKDFFTKPDKYEDLVKMLKKVLN
ncbi:MAG: response regulator [Niastella sp.]|nr:response regulator [Niastella sp.]